MPSPPKKIFNHVKTNNIESFNLADSFNLLVNNGAAAGQVIFHVSKLLLLFYYFMNSCMHSYTEK